MSEQEPTWAEAMDTLRKAFSQPQVLRDGAWADMDGGVQFDGERRRDVLFTPVLPGETEAEFIERAECEINRQIQRDGKAIHEVECLRIREAMPTTYETSRNMGYWGNDALEKHRQCCALQSWWDPKKRMYRWFRPEDGWRKP